MATSEKTGDVFAPLAMGGAGGLRAIGSPAERLAKWLNGMETALLSAMRHLDDIKAWSAKAESEMDVLSGHTSRCRNGRWSWLQGSDPSLVPAVPHFSEI